MEPTRAATTRAGTMLWAPTLCMSFSSCIPWPQCAKIARSGNQNLAVVMPRATGERCPSQKQMCPRGVAGVPMKYTLLVGGGAWAVHLYIYVGVLFKSMFSFVVSDPEPQTPNQFLMHLFSQLGYIRCMFFFKFRADIRSELWEFTIMDLCRTQFLQKYHSSVFLL